MSLKFLSNPLLFAALIGLHPALFYIGNNWFMFTPSLSLFIIAMITFTTFFFLSSVYLGSTFLCNHFPSLSSLSLAGRILVFLGIFGWAFLLRQTLLELLNNQTLLFFGIVLLAGSFVAWSLEKLQFYRLNALLLLLCITSVGTTTLSIFTTDQGGVSSSLDPPMSENDLRHWTFRTTPNVYYIVPDAYPNRQALQTIYKMDNDDFYQKLESWEFTLTHSALSNYVSTLASVSSLFGMGHHYYRQYIGNHETVGAREFITGKDNPTFLVFQQNGYQIHIVHHTDYLLKKGCFINQCSPSVFWEDVIEILLPYRVKKWLDTLADQSLEGFEQRLLVHIEQISRSEAPQFTYVHFLLPGHSSWNKQTPEQLQVFQKEFAHKTRQANLLLTKAIEKILKQDPTALIILNADHGGFGLGWMGPAEEKIFKGIPPDLIALDHMGVLLAIRWPGQPSQRFSQIQSNVNLFRYIFAYLTGDKEIVRTQVPNHSYLRTRSESVVQVVQDGKLLKTFQTLPSDN